MDIKIRTQAKSMLVDCTNKDIKLGGKLTELNEVVASDFASTISLGKYENMERATQVIDDIQSSIELNFNKKATGIIIIMPEK